MVKENLIEFILDPISLRRDVRAGMRKNFETYLNKDMTVYDVGCGDKPFAEFLSDKCKKYVGVDVEDGFYDASYIDLIGTAYDVPIGEGEADAIISCQVLEHLDRPLDAIKEKHRILKKDGILFLSFPFMYPIHAAPVDFFRYTEFTAKKIMGDHGFKIIDQKRIGGFWYALGLFSGIYLKIIDRGILKKLKISLLVNMLVKWFFFILHKLEERAFKMADKDLSSIRRDWTVNYIIVAKKI